jgi:repressor LexA
MALTRRQKEVLDYIADFIEDNGYSPSYVELGRGLSLSSLASVHKHIEALEARHYLRRSFNQSRSLDVAPAYLEERRLGKSKAKDAAPLREACRIPLLGRIAAGAPVEALAGEDTLQFSDFTGTGETFALQVSGESMIEDHICPGDFVLLERTASARNGDTVVALVGGSETTLKKFFQESDGRIRLQPANAQMQPILLEPTEVQVQGRLLAVLRKYR